MNAYWYARANTLEEALSAIGSGALPLAGGTELLNWMRLGIEEPDELVDIGGLSALQGIERDGSEMVIGALATLSDIESSDLVRQAAPTLAQACLRAASPQLRNRATIGGNVLQKTRCPYFRAEAPGALSLPWPCNKRAQGAGCAALDGSFARAALFGWTRACVATQPSDPAVALAALDAVAQVQGAGGPRSIKMTEFHLSQQEAAAQGLEPAGAETRLAPGELIRAYRIPLDAAAAGSSYVKVRERESYEYAMVSASVCLALDGERISMLRIALGSIAQKPWRLAEAERALVGARFEEDAIAAAVAGDLTGARALPSQDFKIRLAQNTALRAIVAAAGRG